VKILITGGAGFIGTNFIRLLMVETDYHVVNFDKLTYAGRRENCAEFEENERYRFVQGDIADASIVGALIIDHGIDAIINFAAESHVDRSIHDAGAFIHTNIIGTYILLEKAREHNIGRFLHVSTDEVYGDLAEADPRFTEISPVKPSSPYAASKASSDMLALSAFRTHGQPVVIARCSNNYGPYQHIEKFIPLTIHRARENKAIPVYGDGSNIRDWIHVEDHCRGLLRAFEKGADGKIYNFGGGCERRNIEVVHTILSSMGRSHDLIRFVTDRPGHDFRYAMDFTKAREQIDWAPRIEFEDGLARTIEWYGEEGKWMSHASSTQFEAFCNEHYGKL